MTSHYDVAVIGGGIVGLAHAWMASRRGMNVLLCERTAAAEGASVRNFGMIWPIGQPEGEPYELAKRSRELWLELGAAQVLDVEECGSIHLAHNDDEWDLLQEFCQRDTHEATVLTADQVLSRSSLVNPEQLRGGMYSPTELRVDPRTASARIATWLSKARGVEIRFGTPITAIEGNKLVAADGQTWTSDRIVICSGSDLQTLHPETFQTSGLQLCKLQMLRTNAQTDYRGMAPHLASGLTLRHYTSFRGCASLQRVQRRIADESPELDHYGIHVMASQFPGGEVVLGDSHEYGDSITPFDKAEIDDLILRELHKVLHLSDWTIRERWHGIYAKHPEKLVFEADLPDKQHVFVGTGGAGMTMSFALAERAWNRWMGDNQ